nr:DoxX family protein [Methylobacterium haplocladii]
MRWVLIVVYAGIGTVHLTSTESFLPIMPDWVPEPRLVVIATGLCETTGALALTTVRLRRLAGIMLALYAVCVFPANVKQALDHIAIPPIPDSWWYHAPRFAMQPVMVWWALYAVHVIDWPFGRRPVRSSAKDPLLP